MKNNPWISISLIIVGIALSLFLTKIVVNSDLPTWLKWWLIH